MAVTRCASSHLMTSLLAWRNPQGSEENWMLRPQGIENGWKHAGKVISTQVGLALLTITSAVETIAYSILTLVSLLLYPATDRRCKFFARLLQSSSFTVMWGLADAIVCNPLFINVMTHESFARYWASMLNPTRLVMYRLEDRLYLVEWALQHRQGNVNGGLLESILAEGRATQELIDQGANFIQQDVMAAASAETRGLFRDMDPCTCLY
jgi:hypothetical protein